MKKIFAALSLLLISTSVFAWTIGPMNYQGRLLDSAGVPVTATLPFNVRIYDAASGGTLKFSEQHNSVAVDDGVYSFLVSTGTNSTGAWDIALWNTAQLFMEIEVNGETLSPRHLMAAAPYAFQANLALTTNNALALGGVSSGTVLQDICKSGKGKWLELANKCLGIGASFPGPALVNLSTLTASTDLRNLDLSSADISGIRFGYANMTGTVFNQTIYAVAGMTTTNLTNTVWDGAIATDASPFVVSSNTYLAGATMKNMDLSKWNLSAMVAYDRLLYFSAAYLTACPAAVFGYTHLGDGWQCKLMRAAGSQYFMVGPYGNSSATSAAAITTDGEVYLDVDDNVFDSVSTSYNKFQGVVLTQSFLNGSLYRAELRNATLRNISIVNTNMNGNFAGATLENVIVGPGLSMNNGDWSGSKLTNVRFKNTPNVTNFTKATLSEVSFDWLQSPNFTDAVLVDVNVFTLTQNPTSFVRTRILGDFHISVVNAAAAPTMVFQDVDFDGATISGALTDINFTGTTRFNNVVFKNLDLCSVTFNPTLGTAPHAALATVKWEGPVECPDGTDLLGIPPGATPFYSNTCNYLTRTSTPIAVGSCTAAIPGTLQ